MVRLVGTLLCLGSLRSPLAPGIYVAVGALWLLTLLAARVQRARDVAFLVFAFLIIPGGPPLQSALIDIALSSIGQMLMVAIALRAVWRPAETAIGDVSIAGREK